MRQSQRPRPPPEPSHPLPRRPKPGTGTNNRPKTSNRQQQLSRARRRTNRNHRYRLHLLNPLHRRRDGHGREQAMRLPPPIPVTRPTGGALKSRVKLEVFSPSLGTGRRRPGLEQPQTNGGKEPCRSSLHQLSLPQHRQGDKQVHSRQSQSKHKEKPLYLGQRSQEARQPRSGHHPLQKIRTQGQHLC